MQGYGNRQELGGNDTNKGKSKLPSFDPKEMEIYKLPDK